MVVRRRLVVRGTVQGVGFRPWAARTATELGLSGVAWNESDALLVEVEGPAAQVSAFAQRLASSPPPLALVSSVDAGEIPARGDLGFRIAPSAPRGGPAASIPVDVAVCDACLAELDDPADRRFRYPFTNCTDCGPRYTIIRSLPYDRASTTMDGFALCAQCRSEYEDPLDRRFHAEPIACPDCGPTLSWEPTAADPTARGDAALAATVSCLLAGGIVAVKGLGGYHLAVVADDDHATEMLRRRKARDDKPFAVMVSSVEAADALVVLDDAARAELTSPRRPIVVAPRRPGAPVAPLVITSARPTP